MGWTVGQNIQIDYRWSAGTMDDTRKYAAELVALAPDVIFAPGSAGLGPALQATRSIPIVFALVPDPVGSGFVNSLARPGGNVTGFTAFDYGIGAKWLDLLKEVAPNVTRAGVIRDPTIAAGLGMWAAIQSASPATGIEVSPINMTDAGEIERAVAAFAQPPNGGLIVTGSALTVRHRDLIIALAARNKLPAIYYDPYDVAAGGLFSYRSSTTLTSSAAPPAMWTASLRARSPLTCQPSSQRNMSSSSTSRPQKRSALASRKRCLPPPTR